MTQPSSECTCRVEHDEQPSGLPPLKHRIIRGPCHAVSIKERDALVRATNPIRYETEIGRLRIERDELRERLDVRKAAERAAKDESCLCDYEAWNYQETCALYALRKALEETA